MRAERTSSKLWYLLLAAPFAGLLFPSLYNRMTPALWGFPFFYWYQLVWVLITSVLLFVVYRQTRHD